MTEKSKVVQPPAEYSRPVDLTPSESDLEAWRQQLERESVQLNRSNILLNVIGRTATTTGKSKP